MHLTVWTLVGVVILSILLCCCKSAEIDSSQLKDTFHHNRRSLQSADPSYASSEQQPHHIRHAQHRFGGTNPHNANAIIKECKGCARNQVESQLDKDTWRHMMLEKEKQKILKKLKLTEPPIITGQVSNDELPEPLVNGDEVIPHNEYKPSLDLEDYFGKTEQVIVFSESESPNPNYRNRRNISSVWLTFQLPKEVVGEKIEVKVSSAKLWVYKQPDAYHEPHRNLTFRVTEMNAGSPYNEHKTISVESKHYEGWEILNLTSTVESWINKTLNLQRQGIEYQPLTLQIGCKNCSKRSGSPIDINLTTKHPFLVINIAGTVQKKRRRRHIDCQPGLSECCRESFKVNFREIGWGWITQPEEYDAYYCKGSCSGVNAVTHSLDSHATVMQKYVQFNSHGNRTAELAPCCTAQRLSPISLVYQMDNKTFIHKEIPNMVVEACGCN